jgi:DNA polymerase-3 subunit epsilon
MVATDYHMAFTRTWKPHLGWGNARFVVVDTETTGLNPSTDRVISIGAVAVIDEEVHIDDAFESLTPVSHNTSAVFYHGITRDAAAVGIPEPEAIDTFLRYLGDGIIVGHHIGHDIAMLNRAAQRHFDYTLPNLSVDTMDLMIKLAESGAWEKRRDNPPDFSLDGLCAFFGIRPHDRHTASGDAFLTAQVFLRLLREARKQGLARLDELLLQSQEPPGNG